MSIFAPLGNTNVTRGHGVQNDVFSSNVTVNCDPRLVVPKLGLAGRKNALYKDEIAGKIAVEHDLCDLDVRNLTINGTLIVSGDTVLSCTVIKADGAVCCPLTVRNTNVPIAPAGQSGNALCVEGSTVMIPLTTPATAGPGQALLFLDGTQAVGSNLTTGDYLRIDARPLSSGIGIGIDLDSGGSSTAMTGQGIQVVKGGSSMESAAHLLYVNAPTEQGFNFDIGQVPNAGDAISLGEIAGPLLTDISTRTAANGGPRKPPGLRGLRQSALYVNCVPTGNLRINPVGALRIDGGTTFSGQSTTDTNRGRLSSTGQILRLPSPLPIVQQPAGTPVGTYNNINFFSPGGGTGVSLDIVINPAGFVESVTIVNPGIGYNTGDQLIVGPGVPGPALDPAQTADLVIDLNNVVVGGVVGNGQGHLHSRQVDLDDKPLSPILLGLDTNYDVATSTAGEPISIFFGQKVDGGYNNPAAGPSYGTDVCGIVGYQTGGGALARIQVIYNTPYPEGTVPVVHLTPGLDLATDLFSQYTDAAPPVANLPQFLAVDYSTATNLPPNEGFTISLTKGALNTGNNPRYIHYNVMAVIE